MSPVLLTETAIDRFMNQALIELLFSRKNRMTQGQVVFVSRNQGVIVIQHDDGFAVIELLGNEGEFQTGDVVKGDWDASGGEPIFKDGGEFDAYVQGTWGSAARAVEIARKTGGG